MSSYAPLPADLILPKSIRNPLLLLTLPRLRLIERIAGSTLLVSMVALVLAIRFGDALGACMFLALSVLSAEYWSGAGALRISGYYVRLFKHCWIRKALLSIPALLYGVWLIRSPHSGFSETDIAAGIVVLISSIALLLPTCDWKGLTDPFIAEDDPDCADARHPRVDD
ncbi:MAG: hypothetical protein WCV86_02895 [Patescibacteria group bacterium]|jgi:hypothetical protein